jgi:ribonuclease HII
MKGGWKCDSAFESGLRSRGFGFVAGVDEVGRGSLFGAVVAGAVILDPRRPIRGLNDSKQIEPERREELAAIIQERALAWSVAAVDAEVIDRINIYQASRLAMKMAVESLRSMVEYVLVDAVPLDVKLPQLPLIQGDERCHCIAAASIVAKVHRDGTMREWDLVYPSYGLANHKGYNTPEHVRALRQHGPSPLHRRSFEPVRLCAGFGKGAIA